MRSLSRFNLWQIKSKFSINRKNDILFNKQFSKCININWICSKQFFEFHKLVGLSFCASVMAGIIIERYRKVKEIKKARPSVPAWKYIVIKNYCMYLNACLRSNSLLILICGVLLRSCLHLRSLPDLRSGRYTAYENIRRSIPDRLPPLLCIL